MFEVLLTVTKKLQNSSRHRKKTLRSAQVQVATKQQPHSDDAACHTKGSITYEKLTMIIFFFVCIYFRKTCKRKEIRKQTVSVCKREREKCEARVEISAAAAAAGGSCCCSNNNHTQYIKICGNLKINTPVCV